MKGKSAWEHLSGPMQYTWATLARSVIVSPCYAWISSSGASVPRDTPRQTERARKTTADVGVGSSPAGPDRESKQPRGGRGGGPQGTGPSAAVGRLALEEQGAGDIR